MKRLEYVIELLERAPTGLISDAIREGARNARTNPNWKHAGLLAAEQFGGEHCEPDAHEAIVGGRLIPRQAAHGNFARIGTADRVVSVWRESTRRLAVKAIGWARSADTVGDPHAIAQAETWTARLEARIASERSKAALAAAAGAQDDAPAA